MQDLGLVGIRDMGNYDPSATYQMGHFVYYEGSTYKVLRNNITGITPSNDGINYGFLARGFLSADAGDITITDTYGEVVAAGGKTLVQRLVDHIISFFVKKEDLSSSGTVTTPKQYAADAWQLNPNNEGSYAKSVDTQITDLANRLDTYCFANFIINKITVPASSSLENNIDITVPSGYSQFVGIVGVSCQNPNVLPYAFNRSGVTKALIGLRNISSSSVTVNVYLHCLFIK